MRIQDFEIVLDANATEEIEAALSRRHYDGINAFWLSHGSELYPAINIAVKGNVAHLHYFPGGDHPGFASLSTDPVQRPHETSIFFLNPRERIDVRNDELVDFSQALRAAREFAVSAARPNCIKWDSLVEGE